MDYDFRNKSGSLRPGAGAGAGGGRAPYVHSDSSPPQSSGLGIRVAIKPEYHITPPPLLAPQMPEIPRSTFRFDFDFERKILAEAERGNPNWSKVLENQPTKATASPSMSPAGDPVINKYIASGLGREAVSLAVQNFGDNPIKVREFVKGYNLLREMGFPSKNVAEALAMHDDDTDKALGYLLNGSNA